MEVASDVDEMVTAFQVLNGNGIARAEVLSVDLETEFSPDRKEASIVDLDVPGGLKAGDNTVTVSFHQYGEADTKTVDVPLTIPSDVPTVGLLSASAANEDSGEGGLDPSMLGMSTSIDRRTVRDVVDELNDFADNSVLSVSFEPSDGSSNTYDAIEATRATDWVLTDGAEKIAPAIELIRDPGGTLAYGSLVGIYGELTNVEDDGVVVISREGASDETVTVTNGAFEYVTPPLYRKTTLTVTFLGNDSALPAVAAVTIPVRAKITFSRSKKSIRLGSRITLTANVRPKTTGGRVAFQRRKNGAWATIRSRALPSSGRISTSYKPKTTGTYKFRARFLGSATNSSKSSTAATVRVR
jgi:hypothetical protein